MSCTPIPLNQVFAMSLDEYIQINKDKKKLQRMQNLHAPAAISRCNNKRYFLDDDELDDDADVDDEEEDKNGLSEALDELDIKYGDGDFDMDIDGDDFVDIDGNIHCKTVTSNSGLRDTISNDNKTPISHRLLSASRNYRRKMNASQKPSTPMNPSFDLRDKISQKAPMALTKMQNINTFPTNNVQNYQQNQKNMYHRRNRRNRNRRNRQNHTTFKVTNTYANVQKNLFPRKTITNFNSNLTKNTMGDPNKKMYITLDTKQNERKCIKTMDLKSLPHSNMTPAAISTFNDVGMGQNIYKNVAPKPSMMTPTTSGADIQSLLGLNSSLVRQADLSLVATKLLDLFKSDNPQTVHKPIYDMKMQKEIHDLQKKKLVYKTGAEVVSSDGYGINHLKVKPSTSGITLNCRFSQ